MKRTILTTREADEWSRVLGRFPQTDVYFLPAYHRAYELNGDGEARAFVAEEGDNVLFYPFMMRSIERVGSKAVGDLWYDIETVYGYSGPLSSSEDSTFLAKAWSEFSEWCEEGRIVAEFVRFNPLLGNHRFVEGSCSVVFDRETVAVRLDCSEEELWNNYPPAQRTKVRKALKRGMECEEVPVTTALAVFRRIYEETMNRVGATRYYYFSERYFQHMCSELGELTRLFTVRDMLGRVASALFLVYGDRIHYHLGGSDTGSGWSGHNNLLFHGVAEWGRQRGFRWLHLGGGRTPDQHDGLFRFKASISRSRVPFYTGRRVHHRAAYAALCDQWMQENGVKERPDYLLLYRL